MDWEALSTGLRSWFAAASGIALDDVAWAAEVIGMRGAVTADLQLLSHDTAPGDELRWVDQGPDLDLAAEAVGNRKKVLSCRVVTRDERPGYRAYTVLERVRDRLWLPVSEQAFSALGIGLESTALLTDLSAISDEREESVAVLDITLNFAASALDTQSGGGIIEQVGVGGVARIGGTSITVPDEILEAP